MTPPFGFLVLGAVLATGVVASRRAQRGYIDFLTPMLCVYFLTTFSRGLFILYGSDWLFPLNPTVLAATEQDIAEALVLSAAGLSCLILSYLTVMRFVPGTEPSALQMERPSQQLIFDLLAVGSVCRVVLRLARQYIIPLPDWAMTPVETFGWAAIGGLFLAAFRWGQATSAGDSDRAGMVPLVGAALIILVDGRFTVSREAVMQPIFVVLAGFMIGRDASLRRIALAALSLGLPLFVWIGAMKVYRGYDLGEGPGYTESIAAVEEYRGLNSLQFIVGSIQDRFHGLDSLIVCRARVPAERPFEDESVWSRVLLSAFVPRLIYPQKQVGWGVRFVMEFWGASANVEGQYSVGISHLGEFYVHGGDVGCLTGMAVLGAALAMLAHHLRRRSDVFGLAMFALLAMTVSQVDRDLEVALGGVLKLLTIFWALLYINRPRTQKSTGPAPAKASRRTTVRASLPL